MRTQWKQPPNPPRAQADGHRGIGPNREYVRVATMLRANPGKWIRFESYTSLVTMIRKGRIHAFRPVGDFESTMSYKDAPDGRVVTYVRYVGEL